MDRMAGQVFRDKIEERKGTEWYDKALVKGHLHDPHISREDPGVERYSGAEVRAEMRHGRGDLTTEEMTKYYEDAYARGDINLNGNAKEFLREKHGAVLRRNSRDGVTSDPGSTEPTSTGGVGNVGGDVTVTNTTGPQIDGSALAAAIAAIPQPVSQYSGGGNTVANQTQDFSVDQIAEGNYLGDGNVIYGNANTGNQNNSMNFGYQFAY